MLLTCVAVILAALRNMRDGDLRQAQGTWHVVRHATEGLGFGNRDGSGVPLGPQMVISGDNVQLHFPDGPVPLKPTTWIIHRVDRRADLRIDLWTRRYRDRDQ